MEFLLLLVLVVRPLPSSSQTDVWVEAGGEVGTVFPMEGEWEFEAGEYKGTITILSRVYFLKDKPIGTYCEAPFGVGYKKFTLTRNATIYWRNDTKTGRMLTIKRRK